MWSVHIYSTGKDESACGQNPAVLNGACGLLTGWKSQVADMRFPLRLSLNKITAPARRRAECQDPWLNELTSNWGDVPGTQPLPEREKEQSEGRKTVWQ